MGTVRIERCPDCLAMVGEGLLYDHQQSACTAKPRKRATPRSVSDFCTQGLALVDRMLKAESERRAGSSASGSRAALSAIGPGTAGDGGVEGETGRKGVDEMAVKAATQSAELCGFEAPGKLPCPARADGRNARGYCFAHDEIYQHDAAVTYRRRARKDPAAADRWARGLGLSPERIKELAEKLQKHERPIALEIQ